VSLASHIFPFLFGSGSVVISGFAFLPQHAFCFAAYLIRFSVSYEWRGRNTREQPELIFGDVGLLDCASIVAGDLSYGWGCELSADEGVLLLARLAAHDF
jgi:hypothetical protein